MSAPPLKGQAATCNKKRRYPCELTARAAAMDAIERYRNTDALSVYRCRICSGWHLTKQVNGKVVVTETDPITPVVRIKEET